MCVCCDLERCLSYTGAMSLSSTGLLSTTGPSSGFRPPPALHRSGSAVALTVGVPSGPPSDTVHAALGSVTLSTSASERRLPGSQTVLGAVTGQALKVSQTLLESPYHARPKKGNAGK